MGHQPCTNNGSAPRAVLMASTPGQRRKATESDGRVATKPDRERASGVEMEACLEACGAREGLAPVYRPRRAYHDVIVGYVTGWTAAHISQMLAIHRRRWPFIRIVTSADTRTPERASTQPDLASRTLPLCDVSRRTTGDQRGRAQHHGDVGLPGCSCAPAGFPVTRCVGCFLHATDATTPYWPLPSLRRGDSWADERT